MAYLELEGVPLASLPGTEESQQWLKMDPDLQEDQLAWSRVAVLCLELQGEVQVRVITMEEQGNRELVAMGTVRVCQSTCKMYML